MRKINCWEAQKCGREPGGMNSSLGVCPVSMETALDGVHGGRQAGRACWIIGGTLCNNQVQGAFSKKFESCERCNFYQLVRQEEGTAFTMSVILLHKVRGGFEPTQKAS